MTLRQNVVLMILLTLICSPLFLQAASSLTATRPAARITHVLLSTYADKDGNFYTGPLSRTRDIQSSTFLSSIRIRGGGLALGRTSTNASSQKEDPQPLLSKLLNVLFKGVTMPFPTLRKLSETSQDDNRKMRVGFSLRESIMAIVIYLALGVVSYSSTILQHDQAWSFVDALYFGVVTFTSVGYGDLCPTTTVGKMFTILFGLSGIALLGAAIATIGSRMMDRENALFQAAQEASRKRMLQLFQAFHKGEKELSNDEEKHQESLWRRTIGNLLKKSVPAVVVLVVGGTIMGRIEGWLWTDSIYYSFITAGTLGYGDFSPVTRNGRLWGIVFIPLSVAAAGEVLGNVASALMERRQEQVYEQLMERELNLQRLLEMDTDQDGKVTREEYVHFMLKEMDLVTDKQFEELYTQFERLDADGGGYLDKNDLQLKLFQRDLQAKTTTIK